MQTLMNVVRAFLIESGRRPERRGPNLRATIRGDNGIWNLLVAINEDSAYLLKESAFAEVVAALDSVRNGVPFVSWQIPAKVKETLQQSAADAPQLTARECQVLQMIADGIHSKQIALNLGLSDKTIQAHRCNLMAKLNIFSVAELTKYAIRHNLSSLE